MTPNKVLVTGSGGCIGAWVISLLSQQSVEVVAFDLSANRRRLTLLMDERANDVTWEVGDIADTEAVCAVVEKHQVDAIIHLAALQVPFCRQNPVLGAQVNVVGTVNVFEAARCCHVNRLAYASSVAATAMVDQSPWLQTLYGAYKICNEQVASVYWNDWQVASVGIRPSVVYGVCRDQGMSALPTQSILAACLNQPYTIPFSGAVGFVYAKEAAAAFIQAVGAPGNGATVFDLNGIEMRVEDFVTMVKEYLPQADIHVTGEVLPFPSSGTQQALVDYIGDFYQCSVEVGIKETIDYFQQLIQSGKLSVEDLRNL